MSELPNRDAYMGELVHGPGYRVIVAYMRGELLTPREALDKSYQHFMENCNCSCCDIHAGLIMDALGAPEVDDE